MKPDDFAKKHLEGLGLSSADEASTAKVLQFLQRQPSVLAPTEPPPGYENELLMALRRKLPLEKSEPKKAGKPAVAKGGGGFFSRPQFAWAFSAVFAGIAMLTIWNYQEPHRGDADLLATTAVRGGQDAVDHWVATMGDSFHRQRVARADLDVLGDDLSAEDKQKAEQVLRNVAERMGMK